jgi:hypothetical protein
MPNWEEPWTRSAGWLISWPYQYQQWQIMPVPRGLASRYSYFIPRGEIQVPPHKTGATRPGLGSSFAEEVWEESLGSIQAPLPSTPRPKQVPDSILLASHASVFRLSLISSWNTYSGPSPHPPESQISLPLPKGRYPGKTWRLSFCLSPSCVLQTWKPQMQVQGLHFLWILPFLTSQACVKDLG